jgi:hypothetical protein
MKFRVAFLSPLVADAANGRRCGQNRLLNAARLFSSLNRSHATDSSGSVNQVSMFQITQNNLAWLLH